MIEGENKIIMNEYVEKFLDMVQINSESSNEKNFVNYLKKFFENEFKAKAIIDDYGNLIIKIPAINSQVKEPILFGVHADTVKPGRDIVPILENGIIKSKGNTILGADDKAGIAELCEGIKKAKKHPPLEIVITREEEIGSLGAKNLDYSLIKSRKGFVVDGILGEVIIGGPSRMVIEVNVIGKSAHAGSRPEEGISSIKAASNAISILKEGWIDTETNVNVGLINGGSVLNAVPERTTVRIECRSKSHKKCLYQTDLIKEVFYIAAKSIGAKIDVKTELGMKAYKIAENLKIVQIAKKASEDAGFKKVKLSVICGGTDATHYNEKNIETVVIGVGTKKSHTIEENISIKDMRKAANIIQNILQELS